MVENNAAHADLARNLLFELQALMEVAEKAGVETEKAHALLKKATIASRIGGEAAVRNMVSILSEGKVVLEKTIVESLHQLLEEIRKEINEKREKIPANSYILVSYTTAVNAFKRREYHLALKNVVLCKNSLIEISMPVKGRAYGRFFASDPIPCVTCGGKVKTGFPVIKCLCGQTHHDTCAMREGHCTCGAKFGPQGQVERGD